MAIQRPFSINISSKTIDANENNLVTWKISGDVQTSYKVDVYINSDNTLIHTSTKVTSYNLSYTIPSGVLINGEEYKITVTAYNNLDASATSHAEIFRTSSRPIVTITPPGTVSTYATTFSAVYEQEEDVPLQSYIVNLYNSQNVLIDHSDIRTDLPMEQLFSNLETDKSYYIEFQVTSEKGLVGVSKIPFDVSYLRPKLGVNLQASNIDNAGISLSWFVTQILGVTDGTVEFVDDDKLDTTNGRVWFDDGFSIERDFSLKVWLEDFQNNVPLITLTGDNGKIVVKYNPILESFVLTKTSTIFSTTYQSDSVMEYSFILPWQVTVVTGNKAILLIQQIDSDINLDVTTFN